MLKAEELKLLIHLKQYSAASKETCALFVSDYSLRPLVRYKYISSANGIYRLTKKGSDCVEHISVLVGVSGNAKVIERALKTSHIGALFASLGIQSAGVLRGNAFIPSNRWREIRSGIISTTRFNGVLCYKGIRLAVYDIGEGDMEWQAFAEGSLFFRSYGTYETQATGMLLLCDKNAAGIAERIIRHTMWNRKNLMKAGYQMESDKRRPYSTAPIRLRSNYEQVYISDKSDLFHTLALILNADKFTDYYVQALEGTVTKGEEYDIECYPARYFVNPQGDLLKFVRFFSTIKSMEKYSQFTRKVNYSIIISGQYRKILAMYETSFQYVVADNALIGRLINGTDT